MNAEEFCRKCAADGWSQQNVADALGLSRYKLRLWLEGLEPIRWPKPWESKNAKAAVQRHNDSREGEFPKQFKGTHEKSWRTRRSRLLTTAFGIEATVAEHADRHGVHVNTLRARIARGLSLEQALNPQSTPANARIYTAFGMQASLKELVAKFSVLSRSAVIERMSRGMTPEQALTLPAQDLIVARSRKTNHPWRRAESSSYKAHIARASARS